MEPFYFQQVEFARFGCRDGMFVLYFLLHAFLLIVCFHFPIVQFSIRCRVAHGRPLSRRYLPGEDLHPHLRPAVLALLPAHGLRPSDCFR